MESPRVERYYHVRYVDEVRPEGKPEVALYRNVDVTRPPKASQVSATSQPAQGGK